MNRTFTKSRIHPRFVQIRRKIFILRSAQPAQIFQHKVYHLSLSSSIFFLQRYVPMAVDICTTEHIIKQSKYLSHELNTGLTMFAASSVARLQSCLHSFFSFNPEFKSSGTVISLSQPASTDPGAFYSPNHLQNLMSQTHRFKPLIRTSSKPGTIAVAVL